MAQANIHVRKINNGYVVSQGPLGLNRIDGSGPPETFFATADELTAAAGQIISEALAKAEAEARQIADECRARLDADRARYGREIGTQGRAVVSGQAERQWVGN